MEVLDLIQTNLDGRLKYEFDEYPILGLFHIRIYASNKMTTRSDEYKKLLQRLKQARVKAGLSQAEVAARLDKHQSYVSKIESGERRLDVIEAKKIAAVYKIDISELIP